MNYKNKAKEFKDILKNYKAVSILMHKRADGDTIGSALALYESLKLEGKSCEVVCIDKELPIKFKFLKNFSKIKQKIDFKNSLIVTVDLADINRSGFDLTNKDIINIDHHISNTNFGMLNIIDIEVSTTVVLYKLLKEGFTINKDIAQALYSGLLTDSINFTTSLTNASTFEIAKELTNYNLDINFISNNINKSISLSHLRAKAIAINNLELLFNATVAITYLDSNDISKSGVQINQIDGIIDEFIALCTAEIAILLTNFDNIIKVSIRSKNEDILNLAQHFGGGGHKNASGFEVKNGKINKIKKELIKYLKDNFNAKSKS